MKNSINSIQMLRGIAALMVVFCHSRFYLATDVHNKYENILIVGGMGVDLFFMISGFIMIISTIRYQGTIRDVLDFMIKRVSRISPPYFIATLLYILLTSGFSYFLSPHNRAAFFRSMVFLPETYVFYFNIPLPVGWTLIFEMYFYIVFSVCLFFKKYRFIVLSLFIYITVCFIPMKLGKFTFDTFLFQNYSPPYYNIMANPFMLEFLFGGFIAYVFLYIQKYHAKIIQIPYLPYFVLGLGVTFSLDWMTIPDNHYINGMASVAIFTTVVLLDAILRFKPTKFLMFLGSISYTLYLTHFTTLALLNKVLDYYALSFMKNTVFYIFFLLQYVSWPHLYYIML